MSAPLRSVFSMSNLLISLNSTRRVEVAACRYFSIYNNRKLNTTSAIPNVINTNILRTNTDSLNLIQKRWAAGSNFFLRKDSDAIWDSVLGVSNQGRKKGRGKRKGRKANLYRGVKMGEGRKNIAWPGLNTQLLARNRLLNMERLPADPDKQAKLVALRANMVKKKRFRVAPLLRGYSGNRSPGSSIGPPAPIGDYKFEGFDSRVLDVRLVNCMKGTIGRRSSFSALVAVGNQNGLVGVGKGKSSSGRKCIEIAKNRAARALQYVERFDDHTVFHNMYKEKHRTKLFIHKREKGFGLSCQRTIKSLCELAGIKDIHCKIEGSGDIRKAIYCFLEALQEQETHQQLADRTGFYVVEQRRERNYLPVVVAEPSAGKIATEPLIDEDNDVEMDFSRFYYGGKVEYVRPKHEPTYKKYQTPGWVKRQKQHLKFRGQMKTKMLRKAGLIQQ